MAEANFSLDDFRCKCGCGQALLDPNLIPALRSLQMIAKTKIQILSGFRCRAHNQKIGGSKNSVHCLGMAADIVIEGFTPVEMFFLAEQIPEFRNGGIGVYPDNGFLHLDVRKTSARWLKLKSNLGHLPISELAFYLAEKEKKNV